MDKNKEQKNNENLNVNECAYYDCGNCNSRDYEQYYSSKCAQINCYFKDYARKTQECEDLKEKNALLESQMAFNLGEMEIRLGNEVNRSETLLKELKRLDKIKDEYREMSENLKAEEKFLKQCCTKAGEELAKHSFDYDGKEKNLVVQAMELNEKYEKFKKALEEVEEIVNEPCTDSQSDCKSCNSSCEHKDILDIIRKARRMTNDNSINTN